LPITACPSQIQSVMEYDTNSFLTVIVNFGFFKKVEAFLVSECLKLQTSSGFVKPVGSKKARVMESRQVEN